MPAEPRGASPLGPPAGPPSHEATTLLREILLISADFHAAVAQRLEVNKTDLAAMAYLIEYGPCGPRDLAAVLGITAPAATAVVDRLERAGHATRIPHPSDRRSQLVVPTPRSTARAVAAIVPMIADVDAAIHERTFSEREVIVDYLRDVVDRYRRHLGDSDVGGSQTPARE